MWPKLRLLIGITAAIALMLIMVSISTAVPWLDHHVLFADNTLHRVENLVKIEATAVNATYDRSGMLGSFDLFCFKPLDGQDQMKECMLAIGFLLCLTFFVISLLHLLPVLLLISIFFSRGGSHHHLRVLLWQAVIYALLGLGGFYAVASIVFGHLSFVTYGIGPYMALIGLLGLLLIAVAAMFLPAKHKPSAKGSYTELGAVKHSPDYYTLE